jgi:hypothetical protein
MRIYAAKYFEKTIISTLFSGIFNSGNFDETRAPSAAGYLLKNKTKLIRIFYFFKINLSKNQ